MRKSLIEKFKEYHQANPNVYQLFSQYATEAADRHKCFGAFAVMNRLRWEVAMTTTDPEGYKINNNYAPFYARLFMADHPHYSGFFRLREAEADLMFPRAA